MRKISHIADNFTKDRGRVVLQNSQNKPPKKLLSFRQFSKKLRRQKIKLGESTYYLSGFDRDDGGDLRIGFVKLGAQMTLDERVNALAEFATSLVDLPSEVVCVAIWKDPFGLVNQGS